MFRQAGNDVDWLIEGMDSWYAVDEVLQSFDGASGITAIVEGISPTGEVGSVASSFAVGVRAPVIS